MWLRVCTNVCAGARDPQESMEMNILSYYLRNVELLNIRRGVSRFRAEYYPVHYA